MEWDGTKMGWDEVTMTEFAVGWDEMGWDGLG